MVNNVLLPVGQSSRGRLREGPLNGGAAPRCPQPARLHLSAASPWVHATRSRPSGAVFRLMVRSASPGLNALQRTLTHRHSFNLRPLPPYYSPSISSLTPRRKTEVPRHPGKRLVGVLQ